MKSLVIKTLMVATLLAAPGHLSAEEAPHCHVYIDKIGWVLSNVNEVVKVRYDRSPLCKTQLKNYACYSYFEAKENCVKEDNSLVKLFLKDAKADGKVIE